MMPHHDTYDLTIEHNNQHYRIYFHFDHHPPAWVPKFHTAKHLRTGQQLTEQQIKTQIPNFKQQFTKAIQRMKWAILNDPDEIRPDLIEFIQQI